MNLIERLFIRIVAFGMLIVLLLLTVGCDVGINTPTTPSNSPVNAVINLFTAEPGTTVLSGQTVTLRWAVSGPTGLTCRIDPSVGDVPTSGFTQLTLVNSATFTLTCSSSSGTVSRVLPVVVIR